MKLMNVSLVLVALILSGCGTSREVMKNCEHLEGAFYECERID